jgi:hypothetical protein
MHTLILILRRQFQLCMYLMRNFVFWTIHMACRLYTARTQRVRVIMASRTASQLTSTELHDVCRLLQIPMDRPSDQILGAINSSTNATLTVPEHQARLDARFLGKL